MFRKDYQQKGADLREKRKTCLPFPPSLFWKPFNGNTQSLRSGSFIFKMAPMLQIPRVFPHISCLGSANAVQYPRPGQKKWRQKSANPTLCPLCPRGQPPGMAADNCSTVTMGRDRKFRIALRSNQIAGFVIETEKVKNKTKVIMMRYHVYRNFPAFSREKIV